MSWLYMQSMIKYSAHIVFLKMLFRPVIYQDFSWLLDFILVFFILQISLFLERREVATKEKK